MSGSHLLRSSSLSLLVLAVVSLATCSRPSHQLLIEEESDGTPLIRNSGGPLFESPPYVLEEVARFGGTETAVEARLTRVAGIVEVPGGVAVLDWGDDRLKVFNDDGSVRFVMGGHGEGPGEFLNPSMDHDLTHDGQILITDGHFRVTWIDPLTGENESRPQAVTWSAAHVAPDRFAVIHVRMTEELRQVESLALMDAGFNLVETLATVPEGRVVDVPSAVHPEYPARISRPFYPAFRWWAQAGLIAACQGDAYRVELFDYDGNRLRVVEWDAPRRSLTSAEWDSVQAWVRRNYGEDWAAVWDALDRPEYVQAMQAVRIDGNGRIWAPRYEPGAYYLGVESTEVVWDIIGPDGEWIGTQPMPWAPRFFGKDSCYVAVDEPEGSVVIRYRLVPTT